MNCHECKYRKNIPGDCHSSCSHPKAQVRDNALASILATFASVGRGAPVVSESAESLGIKLNAHGVMHGWANWPWNFDPIWVDHCDGFVAHTQKTGVPNA